MSYIYKTDRIELREQIKRHAGFIKGRVLDVGSGGFSRYIDLFKFDEYIKMDIESGKNIDIVGRVENIPSKDGSFDSIVCTQVLGDVYELQKAFSEFYRVLKSGGTLLVTENLFDSLHDEPNDFWRFTEHSLRRLAEEAGFEVKVLEHRGGYRSVMAQLKARYWIECFSINGKWFARPFSFLMKILGQRAISLDRKDKNPVNKTFTHGYILIARKNA